LPSPKKEVEEAEDIAFIERKKMKLSTVLLIFSVFCLVRAIDDINVGRAHRPTCIVGITCAVGSLIATKREKGRR
jgi:hypothetical protein